MAFSQDDKAAIKYIYASESHNCFRLRRELLAPWDMIVPSEEKPSISLLDREIGDGRCRWDIKAYAPLGPPTLAQQLPNGKSENLDRSEINRWYFKHAVASPSAMSMLTWIWVQKKISHCADMLTSRKPELNLGSTPLNQIIAGKFHRERLPLAPFMNNWNKSRPLRVSKGYTIPWHILCSPISLL